MGKARVAAAFLGACWRHGDVALRDLAAVEPEREIDGVGPELFGALGLLILIPVGIVLAIVGLPIVAIVGVLALPVLIVLFIVGLPILLVFAAIAALLGATFGVLMAFLSLGIVVLKVALLVLIPVLLVGWILRRLFAPSDPYRLRI